MTGLFTGSTIDGPENPTLTPVQAQGYSRVVHERATDVLRAFKRGKGMTTASRSRLMGHVRQTRTEPEERVAAWLRAHGIAYRRNVRSLPGRPDFANRRAGFAIFVHGCFWHRHPGCPRTTSPVRNGQFWEEKFAANVARDATKRAELEEAGLMVVTVWECESLSEEQLSRNLSGLLPEAGRPRADA